MLILINKCLLNVAQHDKSTERSKFPQAKSPPAPFNPTWKILFVLMFVFLFFPIPFYFKLYKNNKPQTLLSEFKYW